MDGGIVQFQYAFKDIDAMLVYEAKGVVAAMNAAAIEVTATEPSVSSDQDTPQTEAATHHTDVGAHIVKPADQDVPVKEQAMMPTKVVPAPIPAESSAPTAESSPQGDTAPVQTISVTPAMPADPANPTQVAPGSNPADKPVIYIKSKSSSAVEKRSPAAQQPQAESTQATETSMVTPHPESAMTSSGVQ